MDNGFLNYHYPQQYHRCAKACVCFKECSSLCLYDGVRVREFVCEGWVCVCKNDGLFIRRLIQGL